MMNIRAGSGEKIRTNDNLRVSSWKRHMEDFASPSLEISPSRGSLCRPGFPDARGFILYAKGGSCTLRLEANTCTVYTYTIYHRVSFGQVGHSGS